MNKKQKGISLVVLVITIIVMIIIAGAIILSLSDTNIFDMAENAVSKHNEGVKKEEDMFADANSMLSTYLNIESSSIANIQNKVLSYEKNTIVTDEYNNKFIVPAGFMITNDAENVVEGIVIEDATDTATKGSQFVWIPVGTVKIDSAGTTINNPLERYDSANGQAYGANPILIEEFDYPCEVNKDETAVFVDSAIINNGYYVGRYEARNAGDQRGSSDKNTATDVLTCKSTDYLYNYINYPNALRLSKTMYDGSKFSSNLINSYAWDTALKYFELVTKSNYSNKPSTNQGVQEGKVNFAWKGTVETNTVDKICNVYDMASNAYEWTTEMHYSTTSKQAAVVRGGVYYETTRTAGTRQLCELNTEGFHTQTFRVILYLPVDYYYETPANTIEEATSNLMLKKKVNSELTDMYGNKIVLPAGFKILADNTTGYDIKNIDVTKGIVIQDKAGNEFVWIPVGENITNGTKTANINLSRYTFNSSGVATDIGNSAIDSHYGTEFKEYTLADFSRTHYHDDNKIAINIENFLNISNNNSGYYIGRYEASIDEYDNTVSIPNNTVRVSISQGAASTLSQEMYKSSTTFTSDLINSYAWDTAIVFIQTFGTEEDANKYSVVNKSTGFKKTGQNTTDKYCNIYDLSGNAYEWSTETLTSSTPCVKRGGHYDSNGKATNNTSYRSGRSNTHYDSLGGFRVIIY